MKLYTPIKPLYNTIKISNNQSVKDIVVLIKRAIKESKPSADLLAPQLRAGTKLQTLKNVYNFVKQIPYTKEPGNNQTARTLPRIIQGAINGVGGDCKHYTIAIASLLDSLNIPYKLRLISQNFFDAEPTHIYVITKINGNEVIMDCVMDNFNTEASYKYKYDI